MQQNPGDKLREEECQSPKPNAALVDKYLLRWGCLSESQIDRSGNKKIMLTFFDVDGSGGNPCKMQLAVAKGSVLNIIANGIMFDTASSGI